jgi:hypothetical protein
MDFDEEKRKNAKKRTSFGQSIFCLIKKYKLYMSYVLIEIFLVVVLWCCYFIFLFSLVLDSLWLASEDREVKNHSGDCSQSQHGSLYCLNLNKLVEYLCLGII